VPEPAVRLFLLGHTELRGVSPEGGCAVVQQPKRLALLAYLALATTSGYRRRDVILARFWPEIDQAHGRLQLRKAVHVLRRALGAHAVVTRGAEEVRLASSTVWCDAVAFRLHAAAGAWAEALDLYRGELMDGLHPGRVGEGFEAWLAEQRLGLRGDAVRAAWECSAREDLGGRRDEALAFARRAVELDEDGEETIRRYIALLDRYGERSTALRVFAEWQRRLQDEFGVVPSPETRWLGRRIQAPRVGESAETPPSLRPARRSPVASAPVPFDAPQDLVREPDSHRQRRVPGLAIIAAGVVVLAVAVAALGRERGAAARETVAVLPLRAMGDSSDQHLAMVLAEELVTAIASPSRAFAVRAVSGKARGDAVNPEPGWLGRRPGAAYLVDGSVRHEGSRVRVTVRLVRTRDEGMVWAQAIDAVDARPGFEIAVARAVAESVRVHVTRAGLAAP